MRKIRPRLVSGAAVSFIAASLFIAGCGDDDGAAVGASPIAGPSAYCELADELDSQDSQPTEEQLAGLVAAAPAAIRSDVEVLVEAIKSGEMESEEVAEAESRILAWEADNCA